MNQSSVTRRRQEDPAVPNGSRGTFNPNVKLLLRLKMVLTPSQVYDVFDFT